MILLRSGLNCYRIRLPMKDGTKKIYNFPIGLMKMLGLNDLFTGDMSEYIPNVLHDENIEKISETLFLLENLSKDKNVCTEVEESLGYKLMITTASVDILLKDKGYDITPQDQDSPSIDIECEPVSEDIIKNYIRMDSFLMFAATSYLDLKPAQWTDLFNFCDYTGDKRLDRICVDIYNLNIIELYPTIIKNLSLQKHLYKSPYIINASMVEVVCKLFEESPESVSLLVTAMGVFKDTSIKGFHPLTTKMSETQLYKDVKLYYSMVDRKDLTIDDPQANPEQGIFDHDYLFRLNENTPLTRTLEGKMKFWLNDPVVLDRTKESINVYMYNTNSVYRELIDSINPKNRAKCLFVQ